MTNPFALVIEDDPKLGAVFEIALQQAGFETALDNDGSQFLTKLADKEPALVLLDLHLPYASGPEILRQIRANPHWVKTPVIVATADLYLAKSLQGQAEYILLKPVSAARLLEIAKSVLSNP
jgi:twitching motility two-component system response regulator PilG/twitching motility two-component system response regulator PilH